MAGGFRFANSVVAIDATTGAYKWHFQTTHHDLWDYDIPSPPSLLDVRIDGQIVPILALAHKTGWMYILNRVRYPPATCRASGRLRRSPFL